MSPRTCLNAGQGGPEGVVGADREDHERATLRVRRTSGIGGGYGEVIRLGRKERSMLGPNGYLPLGRHSVTVDEFYEHFVTAFPSSKTRERLYQRWARHREALSSVLPVRAQWIDGSYVTSKVDPADIDVVSLMDGEAYDRLAPTVRSLVEPLIAGKATKAVWGMDSYPVFRWPAGHPFESATQQAELEWDTFWQQQRNMTGLVKGYLEVRL